MRAAGEMWLHHGKLLSLSNRSGHYAPPLSCLHAVLERLGQLGVADLHDVRIQRATPLPTSVPDEQIEVRMPLGNGAEAV